MEDKNIYLIIGVIVLILFINNQTDLFATLESRFPSNIFLEKSYDLGNSGTITLPDGTNYSEVQKIEISVTGCGEDEGDLILNDENIGSYKFTDCEYLTYPDGSGKAYTHYQTQTFTKLFYGSPTAPLLKSNKIDYEFTRTDENIKAKRMIVYEKVECVASSQCPKAANSCSQVYHRCMPLVEKCTTEYAPVCGDNGISYTNGCFASLAGVSIVYKGLCEGDLPTDIKDGGTTIDGTTPVTKTPSLYLWIGIFILVIIILFYIRKK